MSASDRQADCVGKAVFLTKASALKVSAKRGKSKRKAEVYRCEHCHKWHIGALYF